MYFSAKNIHKTWENTTVDFSLECQKQTLTCILGPSGKGKTTILNIIAGLEENDKNYKENLEIILDQERIEKLPPYKRNIGFVFQNGALFNNMNVIDNVAYGLISKGLKKAIARKNSSEYLHYFNLDGFEKRMPQTLSGGEKQRVALARTLITNPKLVLLDEPFSALDEELRIKMAEQLRVWQKDLGFTAIMVTHDLQEAKNISDKIIHL